MKVFLVRAPRPLEVYEVVLVVAAGLSVFANAVLALAEFGDVEDVLGLAATAIASIKLAGEPAGSQEGRVDYLVGGQLEVQREVGPGLFQ